MRKPLIHKIVLLLTLVFLLGITTSCASQNISQKPSDYLGPIPREKLICVYTDAKENKYYVSKDDIDRIVASGSYEKDRTYEITTYTEIISENYLEDLNEYVKTRQKYFKISPDKKDNNVAYSATTFVYLGKEQNRVLKREVFYNKANKVIFEQEITENNVRELKEMIGNPAAYRASKICGGISNVLLTKINENKSISQKMEPEYLLLSTGVPEWTRLQFMFKDEDYRYYGHNPGFASLVFNSSNKSFLGRNYNGFIFEPITDKERAKMNDKILTLLKENKIKVIKETKNKTIWAVRKSGTYNPDKEVIIEHETYYNYQGEIVYTCAFVEANIDETWNYLQRYNLAENKYWQNFIKNTQDYLDKQHKKYKKTGRMFP